MLDKKYIRFFIHGYLNAFFSDYSFGYNPSESSFFQHRFKTVLNYLGWRNINRDITWIAPILSIIEAIIATIYVFLKALIVLGQRIFVPQKQYEGKFFIASLTLAPFRMMRILESVRPMEVSTLSIPFIKSPYKENDIDILYCLSYRNIVQSLNAAWVTIWTLYKKYRQRDPLFRSYSSFEYYLTCCFVQNTMGKNRFGFYNNYDRWAFLMCNTRYSFYIQHGSLPEHLPLIRIGTPYIASFINENQMAILKRILLKDVPQIIKYRRHISFTQNKLLRHNGKQNVLLVCWSHRINKERVICELLQQGVNLYIKPHPGEKENAAYKEMSKKYGCIIVPKSGYPAVDIVISYESTLADEYEDVGVPVIRYDSLSDLSQLKEIVDSYKS